MSSKYNILGKELIDLFDESGEVNQSLENFASIMPNIVWITDEKGNIQYLNQNGLDFIGFKNSQISQEEWASTVHPEEIESITAKWMDSLIRKIPFRNIQRQRNGNGNYEWFKVEANPRYDSNGEVSHWIGISVNINEQFNLRKELEITNKRFDLSIKSAKSGIWDWDLLNDRIIYNDNWWEMLGYRRGELSETTAIWEELLHPEDKERAIKELDRHLKGETDFYESVYRLRTKQNKWLWIYDSGKIIDKNENGSPLRFVGMQQDYSSRKYHEDVILESEKKMRILAESAQKLMELEDEQSIIEHCVDEIFKYIEGNGIVLYSIYENDQTNWRIISNRGLSSLIKTVASIMGRQINELRGPANSRVLEKLRNGKLIYFEPEVEKSLLGIMPKAIIERLKRAINLDKIYGIGLVKSELVLGNVTIILNDKSTVLDKDFLETLVYQTASAIERKKVENQIIEQNSQLSELNQELDLILQGLSHDLRAPINSAKGLLNIGKNMSNEELRSNIDTSINSLDKITTELLDIVINNRTGISRENIDLNSLIKNSIEEFDNRYRLQNTDLQIDVAQEVDFYSDAGRLKIVLRNLFSNALKFRNPDRDQHQVKISVKAEKDHALICITDNGIGMNEDQVMKIFDMFYRARQDYKGLGLGMHIIKRTVEKLDGEISVNSKLNQGTEFLVKIPNLH